MTQDELQVIEAAVEKAKLRPFETLMVDAASVGLWALILTVCVAFVWTTGPAPAWVCSLFGALIAQCGALTADGFETRRTKRNMQALRDKLLSMQPKPQGPYRGGEK